MVQPKNLEFRFKLLESFKLNVCLRTVIGIGHVWRSSFIFIRKKQNVYLKINFHDFKRTSNSECALMVSHYEFPKLKFKDAKFMIILLELPKRATGVQWTFQ